jgi:hypothetical protein
MSTQDILNDREKSYGNYAENCQLTQDLKDCIRGHPRWVTMSADKKQSCEMIVYKMARIISGNHAHKDSWDDIAGFALLISNDISL